MTATADLARGPAPSHSGWLAPGWPVTAILYGYAVLWILGLANFAWIMALVPMSAYLWGQRPIKVPRGFGIWLYFLLMIIPSLTQVGSATRASVWLYRVGLYTAAGLALVFVYNLRPVTFPARRLVNGLSFYWALVIVGGMAALFLGDVQIRSLAQEVLPGSLSSDPFVNDLIRPSIAQIHDFLGFDVARPAAPFSFTNAWGSNVALLTPFVFLWMSGASAAKRAAALVGLGLAVVPVVQSLNRGLWLSLTVGLIYAAARYAIRGKVRSLMALATTGGVVALFLVFTPFGALVSDRLDTGHSDNRRVSLYSQSIEAVIASPVVGHGGPVANPEHPDHPPAGTHGQIWLLLVLHGIPATIAFVTFLVTLTWRTRRASIGTLGFWAHIVLVIGLIQLPFYALLPSQLPILFTAAGVALRDLDQRAAPASITPGSAET